MPLTSVKCSHSATLLLRDLRFRQVSLWLTRWYRVDLSAEPHLVPPKCMYLITELPHPFLYGLSFELGASCWRKLPAGEVLEAPFMAVTCGGRAGCLGVLAKCSLRHPALCVGGVRMGGWNLGKHRCFSASGPWRLQEVGLAAFNSTFPLCKSGIFFTHTRPLPPSSPPPPPTTG